MYSLLKPAVLRLLRVSPEPSDPMGDVRKLIVFRASPNYYRYKLYLWMIGLPIGWFFGGAMIIGLLVGAAASGSALISALLVLAAVLLLALAVFQTFFSYMMLRLDYELRWYKVTDRSLRIREGVWRTREMTMMFDNIQNISITQGPIQRFLKIADLKVQTAGGGASAAPQQQHQGGITFDMHVGYFRGIDNADEVLSLMLERLRDARTAGLGEEAAEHLHAAPQAALPMDTSVLDAARQLLEETRSFRKAAQDVASRGNA